MCNCLSFLLENPTLQQRWVEWLHFLSLFGRKIQPSPSADVELLQANSKRCMHDPPHELSADRIDEAQRDGCMDGLLEKCGIYVIRRRRKPLVGDVNGGRGYASTIEDQQATVFAGTCDAKAIADKHAEGNQGRAPKHQHTTESMNADCKEDVLNKRASQAIEVPKKKEGQNRIQAITPERFLRKLPRTITANAGDDSFSLFTQQGLKGVNQDSMAVWENFLPSEDATFCGVFDGHGSHGHHISKIVRDKLPARIASCWRALQASSLLASRSDSPERSLVSPRGNLDPDALSIWEEAFHSAFSLMDRDLLLDEDLDCVYSGSTAVTLVKQGNDILLANVGDSRAIMGVQFEDSVVALQLTVDLTPNLPREADRIRRCKGRVLALRKEPFVKRVWLPHENSPGLAMARSFGDYILKNFGVISAPEVTHRRISKNDKFVVLATDGVWDVLSNEQVVRIVDSAPVRSLAAQAVVDIAVRAWKAKYPEAKVDDCAVICMFLDSAQSESYQAAANTR